MIKSQRCNKCKKIKALNGFYKDKRMKRGVRNTCKKCCDEATVANRQTDAKRVKVPPHFIGCMAALADVRRMA